MNELMFTGLQMVGCAVMCLAAGIGIGVFGLLAFCAAFSGRKKGQEDE